MKDAVRKMNSQDVGALLVMDRAVLDADGDGAVSKAYGAELTLPIFGKFSDRQTFLVGKDGLVKAKWKEMGAKVDEEKMASVKSTAHVEQVLAKM